MNPILGKQLILLYGVERHPLTNDVDASLTLLIPSLVLLHLYISPFTKVEESFNIQATRDILVYGIPFQDVGAALEDRFDHVEFPGAVPRTFVGATILAGLSKPWQNFVTDGMQMQLVGKSSNRIPYPNATPADED